MNRTLEPQFNAADSEEGQQQQGQRYVSTPGNLGTNSYAFNQNQVQNGGGVVVQLTNQVESRVVKTITMSNIGFQAFEAIANIVKPGQSLDMYCDSAAIYQIYVDLGIMRQMDTNCVLDARSDIKDIVHAMKTFYNKGLQLQTARSFSEKFRYEHAKDPEKTLIEKDEANTEWNKNLGTLALLVDEESLRQNEIVDIIKNVIKMLGSSTITGKKVQAVQGIKKLLERDMAGHHPIKSIFELQVRFGVHRLEEIKALQTVKRMGRLSQQGGEYKRKQGQDPAQRTTV